MQNNEIIESIGIELEFSNVNRDSREFAQEFNEKLPTYRRIHDASCETPITTFAGIPIEVGSEKDAQIIYPYCVNTIVGGEIVSPILNSNEPKWVTEVREMCDLLIAHGESEESSRDSFHVHVNVSTEVPLFALKNLLRLTGAYEAILFRLGGMGRMNRGEENSYCYQRPFLGNGPPIISYYNPSLERSNNYPILSYEDLLGSKTKSEFFQRYGGADYYSAHGVRYVTMRYMVVNFYPVLSQGSFEFRTANKTLNSNYIIAWSNFCKAFVDLAFSDRNLYKELEVTRPLFENREISDNEFYDSMSMFKILDRETIEVLGEIWAYSPTPHFDNIPRYSHLPEPTGFTGSKYIPNHLKNSVNVEQIDFVDIHRLNRQRRNHNDIRIGNFGALRRFVPPLEITDRMRMSISTFILRRTRFSATDFVPLSGETRLGHNYRFSIGSCLLNLVLPIEEDDSAIIEFYDFRGEFIFSGTFDVHEHINLFEYAAENNIEYIFHENRPAPPPIHGRVEVAGPRVNALNWEEPVEEEEEI